MGYWTFSDAEVLIEPPKLEYNEVKRHRVWGGEQLVALEAGILGSDDGFPRVLRLFATGNRRVQLDRRKRWMFITQERRK